MSKMVNRTQIGVNLPNGMVDWLHVKSEDSGAPISRLVEKMLQPYYEKDMLDKETRE